MTWSDRIKSAWITFKREALPLYAWTFIFIGILVVLVVAMVMGVLDQLRWTIPHIYEGSFSSGMPIPGVPPTPDMAPFTAPFGSPAEDLFAYFGGFDNFSKILPVVGSVFGTLILIMIVGWLIGTAFYTGLYNLTAKAYREKVTFKDFRFKGFFRFLGWQGFIFLIQLLLLIVGLIGAFSLRHSQGALVGFLIIYGLLIVLGSIFVLPWLVSSPIYLLAHGNEEFRVALSGSWRFFRRHMGSQWAYIGTVVLIQIAIEVLMRISSGLGGLVTLVISPFIAVLAIVWVLSLDDDERKKDENFKVANLNGPTSDLKPDPKIQDPIVASSASSSLEIDAPPTEHVPEMSSPDVRSTQQLHETKISLKKPEPTEPMPNAKETPEYCPSCGKANTGTAYCPKCGTKL